MSFPSLTMMPPLTVEETIDWYYPAYAARPYTMHFANQVIDLITLEEELLRHLKYLRILRVSGELVVELRAHGELSLPRWEMDVAGRHFEAVNDAVTFRVTLGKEAVLEGDLPLTLGGEWSSRLSDLGLLLHHLLPYIEVLRLRVEGMTEVVFEVPS